MLYFNYCSIKAYGTRYRAVCVNHPIDISPGAVRIGAKRGSASTSERFRQSVSRTRNRVFEIAACNSFDWFGTFTLDKEKYDRYDLSKFRKDFAQFLRDERKRTGARIEYLLIPERHQDGAWHMHGLLRGLPADALFPFDERAPRKLRDGGYFNWPRYQRRFGFCSFGAIRDQAKVAGYVTKYIAKGLDERSEDKDVHLYFASRGLARAEQIMRGELPDPSACAWSWQGEHTSRRDTNDLAALVPMMQQMTKRQIDAPWKIENLELNSVEK